MRPNAWKRTLATVTAVAGLAAGSLAGASAGVAAPADYAKSPSAAAAYPTCNSAKTVDAGTTYGTVRQPYYTGTGSRNCVMGIGARSAGVTRLQLNLNACYGHIGVHLTVDGVYGTNTSNAVKAVQRHVGVAADGIYGPMTRRSMNWDTSRLGCQNLGI